MRREQAHCSQKTLAGVFSVTLIRVKGSFLSSNLSPSEKMYDESCSLEDALSFKCARSQHNWQKMRRHLTARRNMLIWSFSAPELPRMVKHDDSVRSANQESDSANPESDTDFTHKHDDTTRPEKSSPLRIQIRLLSRGRKRMKKTSLCYSSSSSLSLLAAACGTFLSCKHELQRSM